MQQLINEYGTLGVAKAPGSEIEVPIINLPMMSDDQWQQLARENAVRNYLKEFGRKPDSVAVAVQWQHERMKGCVVNG